MNKPDIIEVVGERVDLRRAGREWVGLCLFHDDRNPSLHVSADKEVFHCFACQAGGDVFTFLMMIDGLSFPQAKAALGIVSDRNPRIALTPRRKRAAERAAAKRKWGHTQVGSGHLILEFMLRLS